MRGRTNAAAAGGGAEPVYGVLPASAISVADAGYEKTITVTFPQPIKKLYGLSVILATIAGGQSQYAQVSYPAATRYPSAGASLEEDNTKMWSTQLVVFRGEYDGTGGSTHTMIIDGNTVQFGFTPMGDEDNDSVSPRGAAYFYMPE